MGLPSKAKSKSKTRPAPAPPAPSWEGRRTVRSAPRVSVSFRWLGPSLSPSQNRSCHDCLAAGCPVASAAGLLLVALRGALLEDRRALTQPAVLIPRAFHHGQHASPVPWALRLPYQWCRAAESARRCVLAHGRSRRHSIYWPGPLSSIRPDGSNALAHARCFSCHFLSNLHASHARSDPHACGERHHISRRSRRWAVVSRSRGSAPRARQHACRPAHSQHSMKPAQHPSSPSSPFASASICLVRQAL